LEKKLNTYSDSELIAIVCEQKSETNAAFSELYDRHSANVRSFIHYMIQSEEQIEDIFQETFITFYKRIGEGKDIKNSKAYLLSIARNLCLKYYRDKKTTVPFEPDSFFVDERGKYESDELFSIIVRTLPLLQEKQREAFILREFEGLPYDEIAKVCDTSLSNAKSRVFRAHKKLIEILEPYLKDLAD